MPSTAEAPQLNQERVLEEAEALKAKFLELEEEVPEGRVPGGMAQLERKKPAVEHPPPGVSADAPLWREYTEYYQERLEELEGRKAPSRKGTRPKPPLTWEEYLRTQQLFRRGQQFEEAFSQALGEDCNRPPQERRITRGMQRPAMARNFGLKHEPEGSLTYADQFLLDEATLGPGLQPRVETFSNKSRDFSGMDENQLEDQVLADRNEAHLKYDGLVEIRRPGHPLFGQKVQVYKVHLVYDAKDMDPKLQGKLLKAGEKYDIEIHLHVP